MTLPLVCLATPYSEVHFIELNKEQGLRALLAMALESTL
jgi:hypothetical protein